MIRKTQLKEVPVGTTFEVWHRKFTVLENDWKDNALVIDAVVERLAPFRGVGYEIAPNNFKSSRVREWLNDQFLCELQKNGANYGDILDFKIDLECTFGRHEYTTDSVKAGILTLKQYGKYHNIIPKTERGWWLATPWDTPELRTKESVYVWYIEPEGAVQSHCGQAGGIRPVLTLSYSLLVEWDDGTPCWDDYIEYLHRWAVCHSKDNDTSHCPDSYDVWRSHQ
jgi:hypothetical protein